ncbi:MAG: hypothetical protein K2P49_01865 [Oscillospiraceae bacterium]|nr:hypothetical protein [Oscillospiraceae bacterium]
MRSVSFPQYAEYSCAFKYIVEQALGCKYVVPPALTKRTMELGTKYSPDFVCTPFKTILGSMIEALEAGADTLLMTHGLCRLGYYGELAEQILRDLGYQFDFINLSDYDMSKKKEYIRIVRRFNPKVNYARFLVQFMEGLRMVEYVDEITCEYYKNCGFDPSGGGYKRAYQDFLTAMRTAQSRADVEAGYRAAKRELQSIPLDKPQRPLRVGVVGEFYTVMDAFSNLELEQKLADMGVEVHRWMNVTNQFLRYGSGQKNLKVKIQDLCQYDMGPTSTANIWYARECAERGYDGLVHIKSAACTPEIDVMPVLQNISADYKIPVLYLTYDAQTSDVGLMTRLEAFYDMIHMRKKVL